MSDTPETDDLSRGNHVVPTEWSERLERERDEAVQRRAETILQCELLEKERGEAQATLSSIHRWIERNQADGFIDSLTYLQNMERVTDNWYDRLDKIERERDEAREIIRIAKAKFCEEGSDGNIASEMFSILSGTK